MNVVKNIPDTRERMLETYKYYTEDMAERIEEHLIGIGKAWQVKYPKRELIFHDSVNNLLSPYWGISGRSLDCHTVYVPRVGQCALNDAPELKRIYAPLLEALDWYLRFSGLVSCKVNFTLPSLK